MTSWTDMGLRREVARRGRRNRRKRDVTGMLRRILFKFTMQKNNVDWTHNLKYKLNIS